MTPLPRGGRKQRVQRGGPTCLTKPHKGCQGCYPALFIYPSTLHEYGSVSPDMRKQRKERGPSAGDPPSLALKPPPCTDTQRELGSHHPAAGEDRLIVNETVTLPRRTRTYLHGHNGTGLGTFPKRLEVEHHFLVPLQKGMGAIGSEVGSLETPLGVLGKVRP